MAGQTPEPSFQPAGQDSGLTQGRPVWQAPPSYTPPAGTGGGQAYAAPAPSYSLQDQPSYNPQDQGYQAHDQTQTGQDYQGYQGYQQGYQGYGAQQGQGAPTPPPQWSAVASVQHVPNGRSKPQGDKGFIGSLFDFSFSSFVTPKIVKVLYVLITIWTALLALTILIIGFRTGGLAGGLFTLIIIEPIFILLTLGIYRVVLEAFMVIFRIYEETKKIRENAESQR
jgi:Domain of unknown function (DUF4282)